MGTDGGCAQMNDLIIFPKTKRIVMLAFISFVFVAIGIVLVIFSTQAGEEELLLKIIGMSSIVVMGLCLIYYINVLINRKPALIISDEGIFDNSSFIGAGLVKWEDIEHIDFINFSGQVFLGIMTWDPNLIINRTNGVKRVLNKMNRGLIDAQVNIPVKILSCSMDELIDEINSRLERVNAMYESQN